jgi:hypothetical protein
MTSNQDLDHLRLLSIFHYVVAGVIALFSLFPVIHLAMGLFILFGGFADEEPVPARLIGALFVAFPLVIIACGMTLAICVALAGRYLARRRKYLFCMVVAGIECMFMPFGTVLGVFTIIVLMRDSVKTRFGYEPAPVASQAAGDKETNP